MKAGITILAFDSHASKNGVFGLSDFVATKNRLEYNSENQKFFFPQPQRMSFRNLPGREMYLLLVG